MTVWQKVGRGGLILVSSLAGGLAFGLLAHLVGFAAALAVTPEVMGRNDALAMWLVFTAPTLAGAAAAVAVASGLAGGWRDPVTPPS